MAQAPAQQYVSAARAAIRMAPSEAAPVVAIVPIGTSVWIESEGVNCVPPPGLEGAEAWRCVSLTELPFDESNHNLGWIPARVVESRPPRLIDLLREYDALPAFSWPARRSVAERAVALAPQSLPARERLLGVLRASGDEEGEKELARASRAYDGSPERGQRPLDLTIFAFRSGLLEPIARLEDGRFAPFDQEGDAARPYHERGRFYTLLHRGRVVGTVSTEAAFDCAVQTCPYGTLARANSPRPAATPVSGVATNTVDDAPTPPAPGPSLRERRLLKAFARELASRSDTLPALGKRRLLKVIEGTGGAVAATRATVGGRRVLIGNWSMGSMNDEHYGNADDYYESILVIAEQQPDGRYRLGAGSGSISRNGCSFFDHADLDGDRIDEIVLACEQLEGSHGYEILRRRPDGWRPATARVPD